MAAFDPEDVDLVDMEDVDAAVAGLSLEGNLDLNISMESNGSSSSSSTTSTTSTAPAFHSSSGSSSSSSNFSIGEWLRTDGDISVEQLNILIEACGDFNFENHQLEALEAKLEMEKGVSRFLT